MYMSSLKETISTSNVLIKNIQIDKGDNTKKVIGRQISYNQKLINQYTR